MRCFQIMLCTLGHLRPFIDKSLCPRLISVACLLCVAALLMATGAPQLAAAEDSKFFADFTADPRTPALDNANLMNPGLNLGSSSTMNLTGKTDLPGLTSEADTRPFAEVRQLANELLAGRFPSSLAPPKTPRQTGIAPSVSPPNSISASLRPNSIEASLQPHMQPAASFISPAPLSEPINRVPNSPPAQLVPGVVSPAAYFPSATKTPDGAVGSQLTQAVWLLPDSQATSSGSKPTSSIASQLNHFVPSQSAQNSVTGDLPLPSVSLHTVADNMVDDTAIKDTVGGASGFFSAARLQWKLDNWRLESGIGFAWDTWLDRTKPLLELTNRENVVWNLSVLYYPYGDLPWQPFVLLGTGISQLNTLAAGPQNSATVYTGISHKN